MKRSTRLNYYDEFNRRLSVEFGHDALQVQVYTNFGQQDSILLEVLTIRVNEFGLLEDEITLVKRRVPLYRDRQGTEDCLSGQCRIPGTFSGDWSERLYFRLSNSGNDT